MRALREEHRVGLDYLENVTALLQRIRNAHPTAGLYEAADLQWWWRTPRSTDDLPQLFWFDHLGRPRSRGDRNRLGRPDCARSDRHARRNSRLGCTRHGARACSRRVSPGSMPSASRSTVPMTSLRDVLVGHGFAIEEDGLVETWLAADARPEISPLHDGYRLSSRLDTMQRPHHMISAKRNHPDLEARLRQTSLYRPDLDLVVHDSDDSVAAYGLFWYDPETATGLVEPMRTEDEHQRRGLARHILTTGVDLLAEAGAERIKICFEPDNPASRHLYLSVGFEPEGDRRLLRPDERGNFVDEPLSGRRF